jgi:hypothetical protein
MIGEHWIASAPDHNGRCIVTTLTGTPVAHVAGPATAMRVEHAPDLAVMVERLLRRLGVNDIDRLDAEALLFRAGWPPR